MTPPFESISPANLFVQIQPRQDESRIGRSGPALVGFQSVKPFNWTSKPAPRKI
jgi:hypothetical protein